MSLVSVHGPTMWGGVGAAGGGGGNVVTAPQVKATADQTNGQKFTFDATDKTRPAADYDWAFPGGTPATATDNKGPITVTYSTGGSKTATLTIAAGAGPPAGGAYPVTVVATATAAPRMVEGGGEPPPDGEGDSLTVGFDPAAHTVDEVKDYATDHPDEIADLYDAEEAGKARVTLLEWLAQQLE